MTDAAVPRGVPATGAGAFVDMLSADPPPAIKSVTSDLLDQALAATRVQKTKTERWIEEPGTFTGGHWEVVGEV
jgi:hypothetical protein